MHARQKRNRIRLYMLAAALVALAVLFALQFGGQSVRGRAGTAQSLEELQLQIEGRGPDAVIRLWQEKELDAAAAARPLTASLGTDGRAWGAQDTDPEDGWFFLPSYADPERVCLLFGPDCTVTLDGTPVTSGAWLTGLETDRSYQLTFTDAAGTSRSTPLHFMQSAGVATMYIETETGGTAALDADKDYREGASMTLFTQSGKQEYRDALEYITERGNNSFTRLKRPYQIRLKSSDSLLGMDRAKNWILFANAGDTTLLRNSIAYGMGQDLGLAYTSRLEYLDLYMNGVYAGSYQLAEKIEIDPNRVDLTDLDGENKALNGDLTTAATFESADGTQKGVRVPVEPRDLTGGYLLERNYLRKYELKTCGFITVGGDPFIVRSPSQASEGEVAYISGVMQSVENALHAEDGIDPVTGLSYDALIDTDSWADRYVFEEVLKNEGSLATSAWYYKDSDSRDSKVYAGPVWDYDKSMGVYCQFTLPQGITKMEVNDWGTDWYASLYAKPEFYEKIVTLYNQKYAAHLQMLVDTGVDEYAALVEASARMNRVRWALADVEKDTSEPTESWEAAVDYLKTWIAARKEFLDSAWTRGEEWSTIRVGELELEGTKYEYIYRRTGQPIGSLPVVTDPVKGETVSWYIGYSGEPIDETTPAADMTIRPVWSSGME